MQVSSSLRPRFGAKSCRTPPSALHSGFASAGENLFVVLLMAAPLLTSWSLRQTRGGSSFVGDRFNVDAMNVSLHVEPLVFSEMLV